MISLSPSQLEKPYHSNHELYGLYQYRGERFLEKIEKQEPFELTDGSSLTISKNSPGIKFLREKNYKELGGGKKLFCKEGGEFISLSQFIKTAEFGSSNGQGAGSKNTAIQESTQCVFNSMLRSLEKTYLDVEDITMENISSSYQYCNTTTPWEEIYEFSQIPSWQQSFLTSSNILQEYIGEMEYENHRDSLFVDSIYDSYKENGNFQLDKWNPADIWLVKDHVLNTRFSSSLDELNQQIENMFDKKELIGVSLKKIGKEPKIEIKNKKKTKKQYKYLGYKTTYKSKDVKLLFDGGQICFRTFNFGTNWAGEILGKTASHGKIGFGGINNILNKFDIKELPTAKELKIFEQSESFNQLLNKMFDTFITLEENFNIFIQDKNIDWKISKLIGLLFLERIEDQSQETQNKIISEIIRYASSELDESSVYLKIS